MRKLSDLQLQAQRLAEEFQGLPSGVTKYHLCDVITAAQGWLNVSQDCIALLTFLIKRTRDEDWMKGRHPLIAWNRFLICHHFDWSDDKLARAERDLSEAQLLSFVDSSNYKRFMNRNHDGSIGEDSAGLSLAPCGVRFLEIQALAHSVQEEATALYKTYGEIFDARGELQRLAELHDLPRELAQLAKAKVMELPKRRTRKYALSDLRSMLVAANEMVEKFRRFLGLAPLPVQPAEPETTDHHQNTPACREEPVAAAQALCGREIPAENIRPQYRRIAVHKSPDSNLHKDDSKIIRILEASPEVFKAYLEQEHDRSGYSSWQNSLQSALRRYASDLSLHPSLVNRMTNQHGYERTLQAVLTLGQMTEKGAIIQNPAAYATAIAKRACPTLQ